MIKPISVLHDFIEKQLTFCENNIPDEKNEDSGSEELDILFRKQLYDF
jgi:hypothetical protein